VSGSSTSSKTFRNSSRTSSGPGVVEVRPETFPRALRHRKWRRSRGDPPARSNRGRRFDGGDLSRRVGSRRRSLARRRLARPPSPGASNPNARLVGVGDGSPSRRSRYRRPSARWIGGDAPRAVANPAPPAPRAPPRHCRVPRTEGRAGRDREDTPRTMPFVQLLFLFPNRAICGFIITTGCAYEKNTISAVSRGASICRREDAKCRSLAGLDVLLTRAAAPLQTFHADSRFPDARRGAKWTPRRDSRRSDTHHARRFGPGSGAPAQYRTRAASSRPRPPSFLTRRTLRGGKGSPGWRCGGTEGRSRDAGGGCTDFASAGRDLIWQRASRRTGA
jgi:hypothetical protein